MNIRIRCADSLHIAWLVEHDRHVSEPWVRRCVSLGEYWVAQRDESLAGFLRFSRFWGSIPYLDMIQVLPECRRSGVGSRLFRSWEEAMRREGATLLMTSSVGDETEPQAWHRRNGFRESGRIDFGHLQPVPEVFLIKDLRAS